MPGTLGVIVDFEIWSAHYSSKAGFYPLINKEHLSQMKASQMAFLSVKAEDELPEINELNNSIILVLESNQSQLTQLYRSFFLKLANNNGKNPVVLKFIS